MKKILISFFLFFLTSFNTAYAEYTKTVVTGTALESPTINWIAGDDSTQLVNLGFTFPFGSVSSPNNTTQAYINSNGGLSLSSWSGYSNVALPTSPTTIIAPYWDDLNPTQGGTIKYGTFGTTGNKRFVVAWDQVPRYNTTTKCTFQVVLYESGDIRFRYSDTSQCNGVSATIGIQESDIDFLQHTLNQSIDLTKDIVFTPTAAPPPPPPAALPLIINGCDDFEKDLSNWTITGNTGISTQTANTPTHSLYVSGGNSSATSIPIDTSNSFKEITVWIRRGSDTFSENPDNNEDLFIQYLNSANNWVTLEQFLGSGTQGEVFNRTYTAPNDAKHANFKLRFNMINGNNANFDFWHIDDVCLVPSIAFPDINISKTSIVLSDPVNGLASNGGKPKRIPGALVEYNITVTNTGAGQTDSNSVNISDLIPSNTSLYVNDISGANSGPVRFVDGSPPSGLVYNFSGLSSTTDNIIFSSNNNNNYIPSPTAEGTDPAVSEISITPSGNLLGESGNGNPSFTLKFRVKVN